MTSLALQASFNAGEWAPNLYARVDQEKYKSGAALLLNWYVDYRGGASTRPGTQYVLQAYKSNSPVRLIPFQASTNIGYVLEFGDHYIRFFYRRAPILETGFAITGSGAGTIQVPGNNFVAGDWIYLSQNSTYYSVLNAAGSTVTIGNLNGGAATGAIPSGGLASRIYTLTTPYAAADLALLKFAQDVNLMVLCHPAYPTYVLSLISAALWTLNQASFGASITAPTTLTSNSTLAPGQTNYAYAVTSIDSSGQESSLSAVQNISGKKDIRTTAGSNSIGWYAIAGAVGYNIYESNVSYFGIVPDGMQFGFIGTTKGTQFIDSNIIPDFTQTPPIHRNPFSGSGVSFVTVTNAGQYGAVPTISFSGGTPTAPAAANAVLGALPPVPITNGGSGFAVGDTVLFANGLLMQVTALSGTAVSAWSIANPGSVTSGSTPANPLSQISTSGAGVGAQASPGWGVNRVQISSAGSAYNSTPTVIFSPGTTTATGTATLAPSSAGFPSVPTFFQQRLVLAAPLSAPQTFYISRPGAYFNFDVSSPSQPDDSITGTLVSGILNNIKSIVSSTAGMLILTDRASWLINGGGSGTAISPTTIVANIQSFTGANDVPPIVDNYDILYIQSKGNAVRDLAFNIYFNVFTGDDISIQSSHLFYGYTIQEWALASQPFHVVWTVRDDGTMLTLTFLKEQQFIAWSHQSTQGAFRSVATVTEPTATAGIVDAVYVVVDRTVGGQTVKYIEAIAERAFPSGAADAWCVDAGIRYNGAPTTTFSGAGHLAGLTVTGLADGQIIPPFVMPASGAFTLPSASKVTIGLGYTCDLQTLALQLEGQDMIQSKVKKLPEVTVRVNQTLGLSIGPDFNNLVPMKDLVRGNVSSMLTGQPNQLVTDLVSGDARAFLGAGYTVPGQFCIRQSSPLPATVLGVFSSYVIGDS